jgi:sugar lactone lactonase YvrE
LTAASSSTPTLQLDWQPLPVPAQLLGESPFWHPDEAALYWCDIPGQALHRWGPLHTGGQPQHRHWSFDAQPGSLAPRPGGQLLVAFRDGLFNFNPATGLRTLLLAPPYNPAEQRFNDGKADPQGRFWVGTISDARRPVATLYRSGAGAGSGAVSGSGAHAITAMASGITVSNGLAFSPSAQHMYWSDTASHRIFVFDFDAATGALANQQTWAQFDAKVPGQHIDSYAGRPDGAAVDAEGCYWVAMFEGQRLLRLSPQGQVLQVVPLPVRCATMPCFGGPDLRTLFVTTAKDKRPADELQQQPWAGCVLTARVDVPGLPVNFAQ